MLDGEVDPGSDLSSDEEMQEAAAVVENQELPEANSNGPDEPSDLEMPSSSSSSSSSSPSNKPPKGRGRGRGRTESKTVENKKRDASGKAEPPAKKHKLLDTSNVKSALPQLVDVRLRSMAKTDDKDKTVKKEKEKKEKKSEKNKKENEKKDKKKK